MAASYAFATKHGAVMLGLVIGMLAKFGRMLALDMKFTAHQVIGHCLMMGAVGLAATVIVDIAGITEPDVRAFTAAVMAIAASDVVKYIATRAWKRFIADVGDQRNDLQRDISAANIRDDLEERHDG